MRGFTLLEMAIVLAVAVVLAGAAGTSFVRSLHIEAARKTAVEVREIQQAAMAFYKENKAFPTSVLALTESHYLPQGWSGLNVFGQGYYLSVEDSLLNVRTKVPEAVRGVLLNELPLSRMEGEEVVAGVVLPGQDNTGVPSGSLIPWAAAEVPEGWLLCDGQEVSRHDYAALFAVIGTQYGAGDGTTTFVLPDLRGRTVVGLDNMGGNAAHVIQASWARTLGAVFGEETHVLTIDEMPSHTHGYLESPVGGRYDGHSSSVVTGQRWATTQPAGGNSPHNNIQPSMAMNWIIKI